jgi:threonine synthase
MDPHTAVGYHALDRYRHDHAGSGFPGVVLSTAHPVKFDEAIMAAIKREVPVPDSLTEVMEKKKQATPIGADYRDLYRFLLTLDQ